MNNDKYRIKAILSFDEEEIQNTDPQFTHKYKNSLGQDIPCRILLTRESGEIVIQNINGTNVCLNGEKLISL